MARYFSLYKPYDVLSQFSRELPSHRTLADLHPFPPRVYPIGRLDRDSEGLLLLSDDKALNHRLLDPQQRHWRAYWAQVEGIPSATALQALRSGLRIRINKKTHHCLPTRAKLLDAPPTLPDRDPPIRFRQNSPTAWIEIQLQEGKNRQVRKMCAAVGFPVLRLVRHRIEDLRLGDLPPGTVREWSRAAFYQALHL